MHLRQNVSLAAYSTMRLGGPAAYLTEVTTTDEVEAAWKWAAERSLAVLTIGQGSNIVWRDEGFPGLVIVNRIPGYDEYVEDDLNHYLTIGAGENWDTVVERSVEAGLTGIEALTLIPGTAGATPVQNVGAYGQEIAQTLVSVEAFDTQTRQIVNIPQDQCGFGYRTSRFKTTDRGRFIITHITLHLLRQSPLPPFYDSLQAYLDSQNIQTYTPQIIRESVRIIRKSKLPDPAQVANNGSFFANPIVSPEKLQSLQDTYPSLPYWASGSSYKLPAAWLVQTAGFKNVHDSETGMATWHLQPLVLVNEHATSTENLIRFRDKIVSAVQGQFGITLQQEPELLP